MLYINVCYIYIYIYIYILCIYTCLARKNCNNKNQNIKRF